ncbi:MAG: FeS-binding protein [Spartobacteria bacterium]|nr:FeS-binding protein [Spartobacteria bacterium]
MDKVNLVYFSPTGSTKRIVRAIGHEINATSICEEDITRDTSVHLDFCGDRSHLTVIGVPVYSGRVPVAVCQRLASLKADGAPAVVVAVYGNRAYDDALLELADIVTAAGFKVVAAGGFIAEHTFSTADQPIALGRPDDGDHACIRAFGQAVKKKVADAGRCFPLADIPGSRPYRDRGALPEKSPETDRIVCNLCKTCETVCPVHAVTVSEQVLTDANACIWCLACVKYCPQHARTFAHPKLDEIRNKLFVHFSDRREPDYYL